MKLNTLCRNALVGTALAFAATSVLAGIADTKHNLGTSNTRSTNNHVVSGTGEICVFCHTPHAADTDVSAPLWNKNVPTTANYTTYADLNSTTIEGEIVAVGSVSLACLSCHDGTQAMDNIINAPGSGGFTANGGGVNGLNYDWSGSPRADTNGLLTGIANLGADLRNDHPIGIQYGGGGITTAGGTTVDPDFVAPVRATLGGQDVWWVDTTGIGSRSKNDMILYTRSDFAGGNPEPSVECASCHDPHTSNLTFLRIPNDGSAVCLACHDK